MCSTGRWVSLIRLIGQAGARGDVHRRRDGGVGWQIRCRSCLASFRRLTALTGVVETGGSSRPTRRTRSDCAECSIQFPAFTLDVPNASATDNAIMRDSWNFLGDTLDMLVASERYQGATLAGDSANAMLQTDEFNAAQSASLTDAASVSSDLTAFQAELANDGYTEQSSNDGSLAAVQAEIANNGTTDPYIASLITEDSRACSAP